MNSPISPYRQAHLVLSADVRSYLLSADDETYCDIRQALAFAGDALPLYLAAHDDLPGLIVHGNTMLFLRFDKEKELFCVVAVEHSPEPDCTPPGGGLRASAAVLTAVEFILTLLGVPLRLPDAVAGRLPRNKPTDAGVCSDGLARSSVISARLEPALHGHVTGGASLAAGLPSSRGGGLWSSARTIGFREQISAGIANGLMSLPAFDLSKPFNACGLRPPVKLGRPTIARGNYVFSLFDANWLLLGTACARTPHEIYRLI